MENIKHKLHKIAKEYRTQHIAEVFLEYFWDIEDDNGCRIFEEYKGDLLPEAENAIVLKEDEIIIVLLDEKGFVRTIDKRNEPVDNSGVDNEENFYGVI